tara:strand:- start:1376 stop:1522 length:147 start_codon:yes stop_codon:yes gene_type:complete
MVTSVVLRAVTRMSARDESDSLKIAMSVHDKAYHFYFLRGGMLLLRLI